MCDEKVMRLYEEPFLNIKNGLKKVEFRLLDEKRSLLNIGDILKFVKRGSFEKLLVNIKDIRIYKNLLELYDSEEKLITKYYNEGKEKFVSSFNEYYLL